MLEIGAGTGYFTLNLLRARGRSTRRPRPTSPRGCCDVLRRDARRASGSRSRRVPADAERLPFEDESFDLVLGHAVLHHLPDLEPRAGGVSRASCARAARSRSWASPRATATGSRSLPKRVGALAAPAWRRLDRRARQGGTASDAGPTRPERRAASSRQLVDVHTFTPGRAARRSRAAPGFDRRARVAARSCSRTRTAGCCARSSRGVEPETVPLALAPVRVPQLPRAAAPRRRACWSRACPRASSTTCCSRRRKPA